MNPYEVLGVPPDAPKDAVRRAYRRVSKNAHPDGGGTTERFELVKRAHDILTDDERRERFDRTGDDSEKAVDNGMALALQNVNTALEQVLGDIVKQGREPHQVADLVRLMAGKLRARKAQVEKQTKDMHTAIAKNELLLGRFTSKDGDNRMEMVVQNRIRMLRGLIENTKIVTKALDDAVAIIEAHEYRADAEPPPAQSTVQQQMLAMMMRQFSTTTSTAI